MDFTTEKQRTYLGIGLFFIVMCGVVFIANGTGDDGDSITHFLYSRDAFLYPKYFFNHWAKPLFVLMSAPFAQLGWVGIKLMNVSFLTISLLLTYRLAVRWAIPNAWLAPVFVVAQHRVLTHTLSSLTEPMFAFGLVVAVWLYERQKYFLATLIASFLPFVRSEGLIILCVLAIYLPVKRQWKYLPILSVGHLVYAIAGSIQHKSMLWVFNTMSYATLDHVYGVGEWSHFILNMPWVTGGFVYFILIIGLIDGLRRLILSFSAKNPFNTNELWLTYGIFVAYVIAHSLFWMFGIFASQGLMRVMLCVAPMMGIICLRGIGLITEGSLKCLPTLKTAYLHGFLVVIAAVFLHRNLNWRIDFNLHPSQLTEYAAAEKYRDKVQKENYALYSEAMYIDMVFGINPFDDPRHRSFHQIQKREPVPEKSLLVWESIFAGGMYKVPFEEIRNDKRFQLIDSFQHADFIWGGEFKTYVFQTDTQYLRLMNENKPLHFDNYETTTLPNKDSTYAKNKGFVLKLEEKMPYSSGIEGSMASYIKQPEQRFKVSFDVLVTDIHQVPSVVLTTTTHLGGQLDWQNNTLKTPISTPKQWTNVEFIVTARKTAEVQDRIKIYVWNPNKAPAFVDNLRIDYVE